MFDAFSLVSTLWKKVKEKTLHAKVPAKLLTVGVQRGE